MAKKAQLTIFITIGVVILILIGIILYLRSTGREAAVAPAERETLQFPTELKPVGLFVQTCLEKVAEETINKTAIQGGRPLAPKHPYVWENMTLSHGYYMGINDLPTLEEMQNEMNAYLQIHIEDCLNGLQSFKDRGMDLQIGQLQPGFKVGTDVVVVDLSYPITLQGKTGTQTIEKFNAVIPSRLGYLHDAAWKIVEEDVKGGVTVAFLIPFDAYITLESAGDNQIITTLNREPVFDQSTERMNFKLPFKFINTYTPAINNTPPSINDLQLSYRAKAGEPFQLEVKANDLDGDKLIYSDDNDLFDIDKEKGLINFIPSENQVGLYTVIIKVDDDKGGTDEKFFSLIIESGVT